MVIYKYPVTLGDTWISVPVGTKFVGAINQNGMFSVYALQPGIGTDFTTRKVSLVGTGQSIYGEVLTYIGSIQDGDLVWHVLEMRN